MTDAHSAEGVHRDQRYGVTDPLPTIVVRDVHERLHVTPGISTPVGPARGFFPFRFGGQPLAGPFAVCFGIKPTGAHGRPGRGRAITILLPEGRGRMSGFLKKFGELFDS